jgi:hypothetical protein
MLNNDMIGNSLSSGTNLRDNTKVRVFAKQLYLETEDEAKMRKLTNRDNDSPSRLLARYKVTDQYVDQRLTLFIEMIVFTWWRSYSFSQNGFTAVRFVK